MKKRNEAKIDLHWRVVPARACPREGGEAGIQFLRNEAKLNNYFTPADFSQVCLEMQNKPKILIFTAKTTDGQKTKPITTIS